MITQQFELSKKINIQQAAKHYVEKLQRAAKKRAEFLSKYGLEVHFFAQDYLSFFNAAENLVDASSPSFVDYKNFLICSHVFYEKLLLFYRLRGKILDVDEALILVEYIKDKYNKNRLSKNILDNAAIIKTGCMQAAWYNTSKLFYRLKTNEFLGWLLFQKEQNKLDENIFSVTDDFILESTDNVNRSLDVLISVEFNNSDIYDSLEKAELHYKKHCHIYTNFFEDFFVEYLLLRMIRDYIPSLCNKITFSLCSEKFSQTVAQDDEIAKKIVKILVSTSIFLNDKLWDRDCNDDQELMTTQCGDLQDLILDIKGFKGSKDRNNVCAGITVYPPHYSYLKSVINLILELQLYHGYLIKFLLQYELRPVMKPKKYGRSFTW